MPSATAVVIAARAPASPLLKSVDRGSPQLTALAENTAALPIALAPGEGEAIWSFGGLCSIKANAEGTDGRVAVIEIVAPEGAGSPLHVHHREDEWF